MNETQPIWRTLLAGWTVIAGRFGEIQTASILGFFYLFLIGPFSIAISIMRRDLLAKRGLHSGGSAWQEADTARPSLERAKLTS